MILHFCGKSPKFVYFLKPCDTIAPDAPAVLAELKTDLIYQPTCMLRKIKRGFMCFNNAS